MRDLAIMPDRIYSINTAKSTYTNLIVNSVIQSHKIMLDRNRVVFRLSESRIHEYVNTIQCLKCQRFGHFASECTFAARCKICAQNHKSKDCTVTTNKYSCHNCILSNNRNGITSSTHPRTTGAQCALSVLKLLSNLSYQKISIIHHAMQSISIYY